MDTDQISSKQAKQAKSISDSKISPSPGFDVFGEHDTEAEFIIKQEIQRNAVKIRVMVGREREAVKIELLSEEDLYFYYQLTVTYNQLKDINSSYKMQLENLTEFASMLQKNILEIKSREKKLEFSMEDNNRLKMKITKQINQKVYQVISLQFEKLTNAQINEMTAYRYGLLRQEIFDFQLRIKDVKDTIRSRNPYLLTFINKI